MSSRDKPREPEAQPVRGTPLDPQRMAADEYLERYGMTAYVKDVMTLLLENRPEKPLEFIADYFANALQHVNLRKVLLENRPEKPLEFIANYFANALQGRTQVVRAYRYIRLTKRNRQAFIDNLASAYATMSRSGEAAGGGLTGAEYLGLVKMLCDDFPNQIVASITQVLDHKETDIISFAVFAAGINACLLYEEFLEHAERLFNACDTEGSGRVDQEVFMAVVRQMNNSPADIENEHGWTIPSMQLIESCNTLLSAEGAGQGGTITYKDFVMTIVRIFVARGQVL